MICLINYYKLFIKILQEKLTIQTRLGRLGPDCDTKRRKKPKKPDLPHHSARLRGVSWTLLLIFGGGILFVGS